MKRKHRLARVRLDDNFEFEPDEEAWVTQRIAGQDYAEAYFAPNGSGMTRFIDEFAVERLVCESAARAFIQASRMLDSKSESQKLLRRAELALKGDEEWFQRIYKEGRP